MKLIAFQSNDGDCLLLTGKDGKTMLIDGGRPDSYHKFVAPVLANMGQVKKPIDLVYVSHIDSDHIGGIKAMTEDLVHWRAYDYQVSRGNTSFPKPDAPRPPEIKGLWHNTFKTMLGKKSSDVHDQLVNNNTVLLSLDTVSEEIFENQGLVNSIRESMELSGLAGPEALRIPVNKGFRGGPVIAPLKPKCTRMGKMSVYIIGPQKVDLDNLEKDWNTWLKKNQKAVEDVRKEIQRETAGLPMAEGEITMSFVRELANTLGQRKLVTPPNLASIMMLVEEDGKTVLLTGDGHSDDILKGLRAQNLLVNEKLHVNVLKVQHHGSEHNMTEEFCQKVTADHYIICGNGAHSNPDLRVLRLMVAERVKAPGSFTFWFNSNSEITDPSNQDYMRQVEELTAQLAAGTNGQMEFRFLQSGPMIEVPV